MSNITFITGNAGKAEQLSKYLGIPVSHHKIDLAEIQSLDLSEVVEHKVREAFKQIGTPVLIDDVSMVINGLGKLPGPFIKFFISELGNIGICKLVSNLEDKSAKAIVAIGYYDGQESKAFVGEIDGTISIEPKGEGGFGWDAIFIPDGYEQTRAEMNSDDYDATSPRRIALEKLEDYLDNKLHI